MAWRDEDVGGQALLDDPAVLQDQDAVGAVGRHSQVVSDQQHRDAGVTDQAWSPEDHRAHRRRSHRRQPVAQAGRGPEPLRAFAGTLRALHTNDYDYAVPPESLDKARRARRAVFTSTRYETVHPGVQVHPLTGERGLFIGGFAHRIAGLSTGESKDILRLLQHYVTRPENILRVSWEPGQLVLFDNRITQHYAIDNYDDLPRHRRR